MSESLLKKEFKEKDVQRARNLLSKDYNSKTQIGTGYSKAYTERVEGDVWEEDGRTWTIKNGIKQNVSKLKKAKDALKIPLRCPKCRGSMKHHLAKKMYKIHGFCFDCTVEYEAQLRKAGLYRQYETAMIKGNISSFVTELESWARDYYTNNETYVSEDGVVEDWNKDSKKRQEELNKLLEFTKLTKESL